VRVNITRPGGKGSKRSVLIFQNECPSKTALSVARPSAPIDWNLVNADDVKADIRALVWYLLKNATGNARGDMVREIIEIVRQVANDLPPGQSDPLGDDLPGG
jgi:hypothetical protein